MVGIALEGGGAKGAYQTGAYIALINNGVKPNMIAGTSIGSINAALMIQGDLNKLINLWIDTTTDILGIDSQLVNKIKTKNITFDDIKLGVDNVKKILKNKGIDTTELLKIIEDNIDEAELRKSKIKFGLVTVKVKGFTPLELTIDDIPEGKVSEYILASCYLPIFSFKKIIDDNYYLDGGFYNNLPISFLEKQGCTKIYAIRISGIGFEKTIEYDHTEVIEIKPKKNLGSTIIFDRETSIKYMKLGYYDTLKVIKNLDGDNYYFNKKSDKYYNKLIKKINPEIISRLKRRFRTKDIKTLVIRTIEHLFKKSDYNQLKLYNIKKEIRYMRKYNLVIDPLFKEFIDNCKLF